MFSWPDLYALTVWDKTLCIRLYDQSHSICWDTTWSIRLYDQSHSICWDTTWSIRLYDQSHSICWDTTWSIRLYDQSHSICLNQGSQTSQMMKFKGISRVIKGSTAHFQEYFWKTVVSLLYVNRISSNFSHLFQVFLVYAAFYGIIKIFPKKWLMTEQCEI